VNSTLRRTRVRLLAGVSGAVALSVLAVAGCSRSGRPGSPGWGPPRRRRTWPAGWPTWGSAAARQTADAAGAPAPALTAWSLRRAWCAWYR